jgi:hypothetical protein
MIEIKSDKGKVIRSLQELEFEFAQGNISKKTYNAQKKDLEEKLETFVVADRVKRLQGKGESEKPLEYWTEKKEEEDEKQAKEELMKKYITTSSPSYPTNKTKSTSAKQRKAVLTAILALIFITGIGFGVFLMKVPAESAAVSMNINQSAFPTVVNNTNITNTTDLSTSDTQDTLTGTDTNTGSDSNTDSNTNNDGNTGGSTNSTNG